MKNKRYTDGRGHTEEHFDAYRALSNKRVTMPFSETTTELMQKAGLSRH